MVVTLEDSLTISFKAKHTLTTQSSNYIPWYFPKGTEMLYSYKNLRTDIYSGFIRDCRNVETIKMSSSK